MPVSSYLEPIIEATTSSTPGQAQDVGPCQGPSSPDCWSRSPDLSQDRFHRNGTESTSSCPGEISVEGDQPEPFSGCLGQTLNSALSSSSSVLASEGQQGQMSCTFDCCSQTTLMLGTGARLTACQDMSPLSEELAEKTNLLVIDHLSAVCAESANFPSPSELTAGSSSLLLCQNHLPMLSDAGSFQLKHGIVV